MIVKEQVPFFSDRFAVDQDAKSATLANRSGEILHECSEAGDAESGTRDNEAGRSGNEVSVCEGRDVARGGGRRE